MLRADPIQRLHTPDSVKQLLTVAEAAEYLSVSERFIRRLIFERRVSFYKVGRHVRIAIKDLDVFLRAGRVEIGRSIRPGEVP